MRIQGKTTLPAFFIVVILLNIIVVLPISPVVAQSSTYVSVINPATGNGNFKYGPASLPPTASGYPLGYVLVNITLTNVENLAGWQLALEWNASLLKISKTADIYLPPGHIFTGLDPRPAGLQINNTAGRVFWIVAIGPDAPVNTFSGSGVMCQIKFNVTRTPLEDEILKCNLKIDRTSTFPTILIDPDANEIPFTEQNGYYEYKGETPPPPQAERDVAIIDVTPLTNGTYIGKPVPINVTVKNKGKEPGTFEIKAYFGNVTANYTIGSLSTPQLASGESITLTFKWDTTGVQPYQNYTIKANCTLPGDPTPEDNELVDGKVKISIFADINADGKVDAKDLVFVFKAFGSYPGHRRWNPYADLNDDNKIDLIDVILVIKNIRKTYP